MGHGSFGVSVDFGGAVSNVLRMKCSICNNNIVGQYCLDFWGNAVCKRHIDAGEVEQCASCGALVIKSDNTGDGRTLCASCMADIISTEEQVMKQKRYVIRKLLDVGVEFKERNLESVEIELVSPQGMAEVRRQPVNYQNKGLTLTRMSGFMGAGLLGRGSSMKHHVYMLSYLPRIEFAGTLAHEFLHIWQNENGISLPPEKCEGLCNVGAFIVYETMSSVKGSYYQKIIKDDPSPVYGDGFRSLLGIYENEGPEALFEMAINNKL